MRTSISYSTLCLLALAACDPKLNLGELFGEEGLSSSSGADEGQNDEGQNDEGQDDQGGNEVTSAGEPGETSEGQTTTAAPETTDPFPDDTSGTPECDLWLQDCPANEKCAPYDGGNGGGSWNALKCVPLDPSPVPVGGTCENPGSPVDGLDNCDIGSMCWDVDPSGFGTCVAHCQGSPQTPTCAAGFSCLISDPLTVCLPECDPLAQDCPGDNECIFTGEAFDCVLDASGPAGAAFDPCEFLNACDPGLSCVDSSLASECEPNTAGCCLPFCDTDSPSCPGVGQSCVPWYPMGEAPIGDENIGLCQLP